MKTLRHIIVVAAAALIATGCNKEEAIPATDQRIDILTAIEPLTKAPQLGEDGSGEFSTGDVISLMVGNRNGGSFVSEYRIGESELYWSDFGMSFDKGQADFSACYPAQRLTDGSFEFDLETADDKDLLLALNKGIDSGSASVSLRFGHAMHRLTIEFSTDDAWLQPSAIETTCTAKSTCTVNLADGTVDNTASRRASFTGNGSSMTLLIVPQSTSDVVLDVNTGEYSTRVTLDELTDDFDMLESGKQSRFRLNIRNGKIEIGDATIEGWGDQGTVDGEIIM